MTTEVVLPSGQFATVRTIRVSDMVAVGGEQGALMLLILAHRTTLFDGVELPFATLRDMPYVHLAPVFRALVKQLEKATKTMEGIA